MSPVRATLRTERNRRFDPSRDQALLALPVLGMSDRSCRRADRGTGKAERALAFAGLPAQQSRVNTRLMPRTADHRSAADGRVEAQPFRHLPVATSVEDTVASMRGDSLPDPLDGRNAFIAAAINAGG